MWYKAPKTSDPLPAWPDGIRTDFLGSKLILPHAKSDSLFFGLDGEDPAGNAELVLTGGLLGSGSLSAAVNIGARGRTTLATAVSTMADLKLAMPNARHGLITGSFELERPFGGRNRLRGVVFQKQRIGLGYFLGASLTGAFQLTPR
jgi:hypothetical protein